MTNPIKDATFSKTWWQSSEVPSKKYSPRFPKIGNLERRFESSYVTP